MSFSYQVKTELCREPLQRSCCALAEAYGVLLYGNTFTPREVRLVTGNSAFVDRLPRLFRRAFQMEFDKVDEGRSGKKRFSITAPEKVRRLWEVYGYDALRAVSHHVNLGALEGDCCRASFIRGAFLAGGSVTDPGKGYHLELVTDHRSVSRETYSLLLEMGFSPKEATRGGNYLVYFKQSEAMEDLLTTLGAPLSAMEIMATKVEKDMRNAVNRRVNCDSANADKIVSAAQEQLEHIRRLDQAVGLTSLPDKLQEAALLRIANPEASLADLARLADPPVTKSCLSHRLRKLMELSAQEADTTG